MSEQPDFVRRKFTLPDHLDQQLIEMADNHYAGNVSLCLRQSIQDHNATLSGESRLTLKRLNKNVQDVQTNIEDLRDTLGAIGDQIDGSPTKNGSQVDTKRGESPVFVKIREELASSKRPLRLEDLAERLEMSQISVRTVLGQLVDLGYVIRSVEETDRYQLTKCVTHSDGVGEIDD